MVTFAPTGSARCLLRIGNVKKASMRTKVEPLLPDIVRRLEAGETLIEVL